MKRQKLCIRGCIGALCALLLWSCSGSESSSSTSGPPAAAHGVKIQRDHYGVPHIFASTDSGAYFGAGYAAAQDRLFQMSWTRLMYQGRISEFFGPGSVPPDSPWPRNILHDRTARYIGWRRHAQKEVAALAPEVRALLEAYAAGVNKYIAGVIAGAPGCVRHPLFDTYGVPLEPWTPEDSIGVWSRIGRHYSGDGLDEARNLHAVEALEQSGNSHEQVLEHIFGEVVCDDSAAVVLQSDVPQALQLAMASYSAAHGLDLARNCAGGIQSDDDPHFSQAWAVDGQHTSTGTAVIVADPRVPVYVPAGFYEWHMVGATFDVRGMGVAGSPNLLVASTPKNAWGLTALNLDQSDLYRLQVDGNFEHYLLNGAQQPLIVNETETIKVKGGTEEVIRYRETIFGPVVTPIAEDVRGDEQYAMRAIPLAYPELSTTAGFLRMYRANSIESFRVALGDWQFPSANVVFANADGRIGYAAVGAWPVRAPGEFMAGYAAQDGTHASSMWVDLLPHDLRPWVIGPSQGYLFSANHMPIGSWYPLPRIFSSEGDGDRSRRLRERLSVLSQATPQQVFDIHNDVVIPSYRDLTRIGIYLETVQPAVLSTQARNALAFLKSWLLQGAKLDNSNSATVLTMFLPSTLRSEDPAAGPLTQVYGSGASGMANFLKLKIAHIDAGHPAAFDGDEVAFIDSVFARAWTETLAAAGQPSQWKAWYQSTQLSGGLPLWTSLEGLDALEAGTVSYGPLIASHILTLLSPLAQCYTQMWSVGTPNAAHSRLSLGQSENPSSAHYLDQMPLWQAETFKPLPTSATAVLATGIESTLELDWP